LWFVTGVNDIAAGNLNMGADNFGIDSLISTEIKNTVEDEFKMTLTSQQIYNLMASTL
jgi:acyl carrier protein